MTSQPPPAFPIDQLSLEDESHLNLLSVFHYVFGGLSALGILFLILHFSIMAFVFKTVEMQPSPQAIKIESAGETIVEANETEADTDEYSSEASATPAPLPTPNAFPKEVLWIMLLFYIVLGAINLAIVVCNILSAVWLKKRKNRMFSLITAGINCVIFPFGTVLGVFSLVVLSRITVKISYAARQQV